MKYYLITDPKDLDGEKWMTHPIYDEYEGSNYGRVRAKTRHTIYNWARHGKQTKPIIREWKPKIKKQHKAFNYLGVRIRDEMCFVHRFICECWHGLSEEGLVVDHINEDKYDNRPENLRWVTQQENANARDLQTRLKQSKWKSKKCPIYVYVVGNKMVRITKTMEEMGDYLGISFGIVSYRIRSKYVDDKGGRIIKVLTKK